MLTHAPGCTDTLHLCISNHLQTKYQLFEPSCIRKPFILVSSFGSLVQQLTLMFTLIYNIAPISYVSILYISVLESHTASVLPQHTVIDEQIPCLTADETITEGKRLSTRSLSDSQSRVRRPTKTPHEAPEFQNDCCFCRVKHFPRYETTEGGLTG